ncbi:hypothetical protein DERP_000487, partial [Dermatophagoides pteronyssinus]
MKILRRHAWTIDNGCRTASYNGTHIRCLCNESGLIGIVSRWSVTVDNIENNNNTTTQSNMNQTTTMVNDEKNYLLELSLNNENDTTSTTTSETYYRHNNVAARIIRSSGFHISPGTMAPSSHHFLYDIVLYTSLISSVIFFALTLIIQYRLRHYETRETFFIIRNLVIALLLIQLTFLLGTTIHMDLFWIRVEQLSTGFETTAFSNQVKHILCLSVPIFLHFIHLASMFWMLSHTILLYQRMWRRHKEPSSSSTSVTATTSSLSTNISDKLQTKQRRHSNKTSSSVVNDRMTLNELGAFSHEYRRKFLKKLKTQKHHPIMMTNISDEKCESIDQQQHNGYETKRYCWMSIEGGIQYSFIMPVLLLISFNTCLILLVLKRYFERKPLSHCSQIHQIRPSIRACIILLPFFCLNWFLGVLSLETLRTTPFELIFALTNGSHSFLTFYFHCYQRYNLKHYLQQYGSLQLIFIDLGNNDNGNNMMDGKNILFKNNDKKCLLSDNNNNTNVNDLNDCEKQRKLQQSILKSKDDVTILSANEIPDQQNHNSLTKTNLICCCSETSRTLSVTNSNNTIAKTIDGKQTSSIKPTASQQHSHCCCCYYCRQQPINNGNDLNPESILHKTTSNISSSSN